MSDGGDCRTAPDTPGLLIMLKKQNKTKHKNPYHLKEDQNTSVSNQGKSSMFNCDECDHSCKTKEGLKNIKPKTNKAKI